MERETGDFEEREVDLSGGSEQKLIGSLLRAQIFYRSAHCYAFVNLKPVLPGRE